MPSASVDLYTSNQEPDEDRTKPINRREFLSYLLGGSIAALGVTSVGAAVWYALPKQQGMTEASAIFGLIRPSYQPYQPGLFCSIAHG